MNNQKTFTIKEIKRYLHTQDSMGDIFYNLSEANIILANLPDNKIVDDIDDDEDFDFSDLH